MMFNWGSSSEFPRVNPVLRIKIAGNGIALQWSWSCWWGESGVCAVVLVARLPLAKTPRCVVSVTSDIGRQVYDTSLSV
jgi:hypothetical protein